MDRVAAGKWGERRARPDSWLVVVVRLVVASLATLAAAWGAATAAGLVTASLAAAAGVVAGELLGRSRLRLPLVLGLAALVAGLGALASWLATGSAAAAAALGAGGAVAAGDALLLGGLAGAATLALRAMGSRYRAALALEIAAVGAALAMPLSAHRDGAINRPLFLGDFAWSQGEDPVSYLEMAGAAAAVCLALFLIAERKWTRALATALLVALLAGAAGLVGSMIQPPPVMAQDGLGLTGQGQADGRGRDRDAGPRASDRMDFRDNYPESGGNLPVAVVLLHQDYEPPSGVYYFRQSAFSQWNGRRLVPALSGGADQDVLEVFPAERTAARFVPSEEGRTRVETSVAFLVDHVRPIALEAPEWIAPARNPAPRRFRRVYVASSLAQDLSLVDLLGSEVGDPTWPDSLRDLYLEVPPDPRYRELADRIRDALPESIRGDPVARVAAVAMYLGDQGTYSRRSRHADAPDPTASFLFGDMTGYCVHFAHAAAFLYRAMGVPARVATGYAYPAADRGRGSAIMLRGGDAHAWPEIYVRGHGWVVVDVSPASVDDPNMAPLDEDLQRMLGEMLRGQLEEQRRAAMEIGRPRIAAATIGRAAAALGRGAGVALLVLLGLLYLAKVGRQVAPLAVSGSGRTRLAYLAALARLSAVGRRRGHGEPPERFAARLGVGAPSFAPLAAAAAATRLGSRKPAEPDRALALARAVATELRRSVPLWRRALGALDPVSWLRGR